MAGQISIRRFLRRLLVVGCGVAVCIFLLPHGAAAQAQSKRLILKDGSYQLATKWEIKDDRVRFFSVERNEWEEIPNSLVDWDATKQYEADRAAGKMSKEASQLEKEMQEERQDEELRSPHVAAGVRLPPEGGVYALETYLALPAIYIHLDASQEASDSTQPGLELPWDRFRIVRADVKGDKRIVGTLKSAALGKSSQEQEGVPATAEQMSEGWIKLTPKARLEPGE